MRAIRVLGGLSCAMVLGLFWGCSEKDDIILKSSSTLFSFEISKLPSAPDGMIYELWVSTRPAVDTAAPTDVVKPLLRFNYLPSNNGPYLANEAGEQISFDQPLGVDIFDYSSIFISAELRADPDPARPANVLMTSPLAQIADQTFTLRVPGSDDLISSIIRYNMEAVSDNNRNLNDGSGIWLSNYVAETDTIPDTLSMTSVTYTNVTMDPRIVAGDTVNLAELKALYRYDTANVRAETTFYDFGPDSLISGVSRFRHIGVKFDEVYRSDSTYPYNRRDLLPSYEVRALPVTDYQRFIESFTQDAFNLPNLSRFGLKWKGWILSSDAVLSSSSLGRLSEPAWPTSLGGTPWLFPTNGRLLPFAVFGNIAGDDEDGNPFTFKLFRGYTCPTCTDSTYKIPGVPGEDFLNNTAFSAAYPGLTAPINFAPVPGATIGSVLVSLEPTNHLNSTTNFPLIAHFGFLPLGPATIAQQAYSVTLTNGTSTTGGNPFGPGFPTIKVKFSRQ